jgi:tetratricopeptide (TPR) repeat protein
MTLTEEQTILLELHKLEKAGRFSEASEAYRHLLSRHPGHPFLLWGLGRCMMHFGRRNRAATLLQQAVAALPAHPELTEDVAQRLILIGHPQAALRVCDEANTRFIGREILALHRVDALRLLNRHQEAVPALREMLKMQNPPTGAVLRLIACLRQIGMAQEAVDLARETLSDYQGSLLDRAGILNEMGHAQETLGHYDAAFESWCSSGRTAKGAPEVNSVDVGLYPRLLRSFQASLETPELLKSPIQHSNDHRRLVFQIGFPRSGTTLVESLLAAHPVVETSGETPLWTTAMETLRDAGMSMDTMLEEIPRQPVAVLERARKAYWDKVHAEFGTGFDVFVDKQPMNIIYLAHIRLLFPESRVIFCERDPRDVCLSCFSQWFQINPSNIHFLDWLDTTAFYRQVMDYWLALRPLLAEAQYSLRYEKFVDNLADQGKALFDYLQLDWDEGLLAFQEKNREKYFHTPSNQAIRAEVKSRKTPRWHHYPEPIAKAQGLLEPIISKLGY